MKFKQRLCDLLVQKNHTQAELARYVGVKNNTVSDWINKGTSPKIEHLYRIAEFFDVSYDLLMTGEEKNPSLPEDELELIGYYKKLPEKEKQRLIGRASALSEIYSEQIVIESVPTIELKHSYYKVSAGTGYDLDDGDQWNTIEIPDTPEARKADYCLTISGNSMEPVYYDGDIVLVKSQPLVNKGEIGIFVIENAGYIKKFGGDRLISLNAEYDDILFSDYNPDEIRCSGLVIGRV